MHLPRKFRCSFALALLLCAIATAPAFAAGRPVVVRVSDGFHWRDAALGAAATFAAGLAGSGLILTLRPARAQRRSRTNPSEGAQR